MARRKMPRTGARVELVAGEKPSRLLVGVRIEERLVKVMKGVAELRDATLGELLEEIFLTAVEGGNAFADRSGKITPEMRNQLRGLKQVYGVDYTLDELQAYRKP